MCNINGIQNCCRIIRVNIADEFCFHLKVTGFLCPVFKTNIDRTGTKITSANTDLYNRCKFFTSFIGNLTGMYFFCKISNLVLLFYIECSLIYTVYTDIFAKLSSDQMMKYSSVFTGINDLAIIKFLELFCELCFFCKIG